MTSMRSVESRKARQGDERWWGFSAAVWQASVINGHSGSFLFSIWKARDRHDDTHLAQVAFLTCAPLDVHSMNRISHSPWTFFST